MAAQTYKIKLASGRILGPLDIERVRLLVLKNHLTGNEVAREYPQGDWVDINSIPEIAELLIAKVEGRLRKPEPESPPPGALPGALPGGTASGVGPGTFGSLPELQSLSEIGKTQMGSVQLETAVGGGEGDKTMVVPGGQAKPPLPEVKPEAPASSKSLELEETGDKTMVATMEDESENEKTTVATRSELNVPSLDLPVPVAEETGVGTEMDFQLAYKPKNISEEKTVVFQRTTDAPAHMHLPGKKKMSFKEMLKGAAVALALGMVGYQLFLADEPAKRPVVSYAPIRPRLPDAMQKGDPEKSGKIYVEAMRDYLFDNVQGYKRAAEKLRVAAAYDITNVKALAMLASAYINLIDSSNKDENYFFVISKLIELARAKGADVPEVVIADVEFFVTVNKAEAAQSRIVEYTKTHPNFGLEMFYYLAYAFYNRGDAQSAARYLSQFPDNKVYSAKIFYLRGLVAEKLNDVETALREYTKAVAMNKEHVRSRLKISEILYRRGQLKEAAAHLEYIVTHGELLSPKEMALGYYLHSQYSELFEKWDIALGDVERSVKLDHENHDYLLELYTLRYKVGDKVDKLKEEARMYYFLGEGEKLLRDGKVKDALDQFLQARQNNDKSPIPLIKIGDMFLNMHDFGNARANYKAAAERAPDNIEVWSKYIDVLIQSYEWEEASKAMDRFRKLPVSQSAIDKAAGDMYAKQNKLTEALMFYKKAMARDSITPEVYIAYAKALMATKQTEGYKSAPFFFALAQRFDPFNIDAVIGTAKCIAATESIERAISMLQDELQKGSTAKAELLAAMAEFQIQKGAWEQAQQNVDQAMQANPEYGYPWKLQAQIYMNREGLDKDALDKALSAYQSFTERNPSDPSGYMERYRIYIKKTEFEKAGEELSKIYAVYPKYPNLHYYKGAMYAIQGNHRAALEEFKLENKNNPNVPTTMVALGKELMEVGDVQGALDLFNKTMQMAPMFCEAKHQAGYANYLLKNYNGAIALYNNALACDKGNSQIYKRLGLAYREMGDNAGACQAFRKYLEVEPDAPDKAEFAGCQ